MEHKRLSSIKVGDRHRKDLGDVDALADSIDQLGLLHPIVIDKKNRLIAGHRRLEAVKKLGWKTVPVRVVDLDAVSLGEFVENACRKDFTLSEMAAIARELRPIVAEMAHQRRLSGLKKGQELPVQENCAGRGQTRDIVARNIGISSRTLEKVLAVVEAAEGNPKKFGDLKEEMDRTNRVNRAFIELRHRQQTVPDFSKPVNDGDIQIHHCDFRDLPCKPKSVKLIFTDPPWGKDFLPSWADLAETAKKLLVKGGLLVTYTGIGWLPQVMSSLGEHLSYQWTCVLKRENGGFFCLSKGITNRWRPLLIFSNGPAKKLEIQDVFQVTKTPKFREFHNWEEFVEEALYFIGSLTQPGDLVADLCVGSGTTAVACKQLGQKFIGCDIDGRAVATALDRLK